jgi:glycosyltransferase involved in cell wall biosynthesis
MPQSVLEACAAGLPVLATGVGGLPEFIEHERTGLLVDSEDVAAFEKGMLRLANDAVLAEKISFAARARVLSMYDIRRMAGDYNREFLGLVGSTA